ncbi:MAG: h16 [Moraxellaceae bacterium]|jgi:acetyl esterase/lipase|nr:h16 [Moraxellaceae bacterium]
MTDQSLQSRLLEVMLRVSGRKRRTHDLRQRIARGKPPDRSRPLLRMYARHRISERKVFQSTVWTLSPVEHASQHHILFLHGGAYVNGMIRKYWRFLDRLVSELRCTVVVPEYPLAPEHHADDVSALVMTLYRELGASGGAANLTVIGTSSGGGIALALAQQAQTHGIALPARLVLLSPWLDVSMSNPGIGSVDPLDPVLDAEGLRDAGRMYAGAHELTDPLVSPLYGPLKGLPPVSLFIGTHDVMLPDCRKFKAMAENAGVDIDYREYEGMVHEWALLPVPEGVAAQAALIDVIRQSGEHRVTAVRMPAEPDAGE